MESITIPFTLFILLHLAAAQPRRHHIHQRAHKRNKITVTDSTLDAPTELPEVVVYVDQFGNPVRTATETVVYVVPTPSATPPQVIVTTVQPSAQTAAVVSSALPAEKSTSPVPPPPEAPAPEPIPSAKPSSVTQQTTPKEATQPPKPAPSAGTTRQAASPTSASNSPVPTPNAGSLHGVTYSPYKGSGGCKSATEVEADFALFAKDHGVVRLYGVDCDQVATGYAAAKKYGNKLFLGIFDISDGALQQAVSAIAAGVRNDWSIVDTVSVGNELVNNGQVSVGQSLNALGKARTALRAAGYQGPVVIVDTFVAVLAHPELCEKSDYCAVNVHPFFDPNTPAHQAGSFVATTVGNLRKKLSSDKRIIVTETGWPWQGETNGAAVPGMDQQTRALSSIRTAYLSNAGDVILFTAFNDLWKRAEAHTFMAEQFWGMGGRYSPADK
ncbi:hypothetical protein DL764_003488 [Monosporascus ibericus]|uniref:Uncharacterized protein n=1 Tax=Monosporascus ibericus TaxID=155417 RepID=A0A4Q4TK08_9PEZI|nr:hypothetical protein DL764_003488 [Monosporascus ibericus]